MKKLFICVTSLLLLLSCNKQKTDLSEVEIFIKTLEEDKTQTIESIDFGDDDIAEFLNYSNGNLNISNFPRNPLSSFYVEEVKLGMYVLWIVESIRMKEIDDPEFYLFASLNPRIIKLSSGTLVDQDMILPEVAEAYNEWWNSNLSVEEKLQINPLEALDLGWN